MCLAVPAQIISIKGDYADVDMMGFKSIVNIQLLEKPKVGEYVLIHMGFAIEKIDSEYFLYLKKFINQVLDEDDNFVK